GAVGFGHGRGGSVAAGHANAHAVANSNGLFAHDRDLGLQRAQDRMSREGLSHEQATTTGHYAGGEDTDSNP
ncbi:hypothetical protein, partial [Pandoraea sp.]